jgi:hypothetical protein
MLLTIVANDRKPRVVMVSDILFRNKKKPLSPDSPDEWIKFLKVDEKKNSLKLSVIGWST